MEENKIVVKEKKNREKQKRRRKRKKKRGGEIFEIYRKGGLVKKKSPHLNVWFRLNGLGSSQNGQNHNWCISGCWVKGAILPP